MSEKQTMSRRLSEFSVNLKYDDIPSEVIEHLKNVVLDGYGC